MKHIPAIKVIFCGLVLSATVLPASAALKIGHMRVNGLEEPLGIDPEAPVMLSWILNSDKSDCSQSSYIVTVMENGKTVWTSGKVNSCNSIRVPMEGKLPSGKRYEWNVTVWDNHSRSAKSDECRFSTGLNSNDWKAEWIKVRETDGWVCPSPVYFRKRFTAPSAIKRASLYISANGIYDARANGKPCTDSYLNPGWTSYKKTLQYQTHDITSLLKQGDNIIQALVTPGWYASGLGWSKPEKRKRYGSDLGIIAQLVIEYANGETQCLASDRSWEVSLYGPVTMASLYDGESVDMTKDFNWAPINTEPKVYIHKTGTAKLVAQACEPVKIHETRRALKLITTPKGEKVLDFGQNLVGWERVRLKGRKGQVVKIYHAEVLDSEGNFYTVNLRNAKATSTYVLSGGNDVFEPCHTFYGFRYIKVEGLDKDPNPADFTAEAISSGFENHGSFSCSNPLVNQLQSNIRWGFLDNFVDVPTDCPQRDERMGWTGDAQVFCRTALFNGNVTNFYRKWMRTLADDQLQDGRVPRVIPDCFFGKGTSNAAGWADCVTLVPWRTYMASGDVSILIDSYPAMKAWVDFMLKSCDNYLLNTLEQRYGDWLFWNKANDPDGKSAVTSKPLIAQCFMAGSIEVLVNTARLLALDEDAEHYAGELEKVRKAFVDEYVTPNGLVCSDTQTAYVLALYFNMLPENLRASAAERLNKNIKTYKNHITTGFLGTPHICEVLSENAYSDTAYKLLLQETCPSWIYPVKLGATTIWERWNSINPDGIIVGGMNSFNHYSYGAIGDWLYRYALGIRETQPGYRTFIVDPVAGGDFTYAEGGTDSPYGRIQVRWDAVDNKIVKLKVDVPVGTTATIHCPDGTTVTKGSGHWEFSK